MPSQYVNGIVLLEHIAHHMMGGIGLRQVLDWLVYVNAVLDDEHWPKFQKMAQKAGLEDLAKAVTKTGMLYFGLPDRITWCKEFDSEICTQFLNYMFENGNFGKKQKEIGKIARIEHRSSGLKGFFINLQQAGEYNWKAYKKHRWLRPFAWLYQIGRYTRQVLTIPEGMGKLIVGNAELKRRKKLMKCLEIHNMTAQEMM